MYNKLCTILYSTLCNINISEQELNCMPYTLLTSYILDMPTE